MPNTATIELDGKRYDLPTLVGTENERAVDVSALLAKTGYITLDDGLGNTGSCKSAITFIDGDQGILRYRGVPIEQLAEKSTFVETAYLVIFGELPTAAQLADFSAQLTSHEMLHEGVRSHFDGFPSHGHPMAILSAMINTMSLYQPEVIADNPASFQDAAARLLSKVRTITAATYKTSIGEPFIYPKPAYKYCENFLHMMFSIPYREYVPDPDIVQALDLILLLHADHEQNCSTSTVRMVASSGANMYASCAAGVCALWGPLHGGANAAVIEMLEFIRQSGMDVKQYIEKVKTAKDTGVRLMGFGHRVYKNFDPRAKIIKQACDRVLGKLHRSDPLLDIAKHLEEVALGDSYFVERKLYPNVDFYSGIIMRAIGIPLNMFTVMFAIGRMPGWIANWKEVRDNPKGKIYRPRQVYTGPTLRPYTSLDQRKK